MFSDSPVESTSFVVAADSKRNESHAYCQTTEQVIVAKETQTELPKEFCCQTETSGLNESPSYDVDKLASFLRKIYPKLVEELEKCDSTPQTMLQCPLSNEETHPLNIHTVDLKNIQEKVVSCLSFSSDGKSLAVAFSIENHESWCTHSCEICVYKLNLDDHSTFPLKHTLKTSSCVNHISFHPNFPSLLACGLHNGQVFVWSLVPEVVEQSFNDVHSSDVKHSDAVTSISWLQSREMFVSSGRDGVIIFWNYNIMKLTANSRYFISSKYANPKIDMNDHAEILCVGVWNSKDSIQFIVGIEGGNILHCSNSQNEMSKIPQRPGFLDPFVMKYKPYDGLVTCISCTEKDIFATCGTNYEIRVYKSREKLPFHVIYTNFQIFQIEWLEAGSDVIACWGCGQNIYFNNIKTKDWLQPLSVKLKNPDSNITAVTFTRKRWNIIAIGTDKGELNIWRMPNLSVVNKLASISV